MEAIDSDDAAGFVVGADFERLPGGHWPMLEAHIDPWMTALHRWMVTAIGPDLLLLRGDEDLTEE